MTTDAESQETTFKIGAEARCSDGVCGEVSRVVIDPLDRSVTHLVVEPRHRRGLGRLVPLHMLREAPDGVRLSCTLAEFERLATAEETEFMPGDPYSEYGLGGVYGLGGGLAVGGASTTGPIGQSITRDTLPAGEVAVRRGDQVHALDGHIGHIRGVVVGPDHRVAYVVLQEGHLFGRKQVSIPVGSITGVRNGIELDLTKHQIENLPAPRLEPTTAAEMPSRDEPAMRGPLRIRVGSGRGTSLLDGAWWPQSDDPTVEVVDLVDHFPGYAGQIAGLSLSAPDWATTDGVWALHWIQAEHGPVSVGLLPGADVHLAVVTLPSQRRLRLLVVPSATTTKLAAAIMERAVEEHRAPSPSELLEPPIPDRSEPGIDAWDDDGGG